PIDWDAWDIVGQSATEVRFRKPMTLVNYSTTQMTVDVDRTVRLLSNDDVARLLGVSPGSAVRTVAFESSNMVTNAGTAEWKPETGLVSVWILGMFNPSADTTIALPSGPRVDPRSHRHRRVLRESPRRSAGDHAVGCVLPRRRAVSQQDRSV